MLLTRIRRALNSVPWNNQFFPYRSCATAYVLLAEEEATTIVDAEKYFKQALKAGEMMYRKSQNCHSQSPQHEAQLSKPFWITAALLFVWSEM